MKILVVAVALVLSSCACCKDARPRESDTHQIRAFSGQNRGSWSGGWSGGWNNGTGSVVDCGNPPGAPSVWVDGTNLDGASNTTLTDGAEFDGTPTITNLGSLGGTFSGAAGLSPTYDSTCIGSRGCMSFDGTNDVAASSLAAASFQFVHTGPSTCYVVAQPVRNVASGTTGNMALVSTSRANVGETGAVYWMGDTQYNNPTARADLYDGAAPAAITLSSATGVYFQQSWTREQVWYNAGDVGNDLVVTTNGVLSASGEPTAPVIGAPTRTMQIGAAFNAIYWSGLVYQVVCYNSALSPGDQTLLDTWGQCKVTTKPYPVGSCATGAAKLCGTQTPCRLGVMGDSLSMTTPAPTEWPDVLRANIGGTNMVVINEAVSGARITTAKTTQWTDRLKNEGLSALIIFIGRNDIDDGTVATTVLADVATVANEAIAAGIKVMTISALPAGLSAGWSAADQIQTDAFNAGLASAVTTCRTHLDVYTTFEEPTNTDDLLAIYDSGDGLHMNQTGQDALEAIVRPLVGP